MNCANYYKMIMWWLMFQLMKALIFPSHINAVPIKTSCSNRECINAAKYIQSRIDENVNPCEDFYKFACGNYEKNNPIGSNIFSDISTTMTKQLLQILTRESTSNDVEALQKAQQFFKTCMIDPHKREPLRPIYDLIFKEFGIWPSSVLSNGIGKLFIDLTRKGRNLGFDPNAVLSVNILPSLKGSRQRIIFVAPPTLAIAIAKNSDLSSTLLKYYMQLLMMVGLQFAQYNTGEMVSDPQKEFTIYSWLMEAVNFELMLAKAAPEASQLDDIYDTFDTITIEQAQKDYPFINWLEFFKAILGSEVFVTSSESFVIYSPEYVKKLKHILVTGFERPLTNYIIWKYIVYGLKLSMGASQDHRWKTCLTLTMAGFDAPLTKKYLNLYFSQDNKAAVAEMAVKIKEVMLNDFESSLWIDSISKKNIYEKIDALVTRVAYTNDLLDQGDLTRRYSRMKLHPFNYLASAMSLSKFVLDYITWTLHQPINRNVWPYYVSTLSVNAFYIPVDNSITIPAALLQKEIYSTDRPTYLNYGCIGYILGHELSHAFDNTGRLFDKYGRRNNQLWTNYAAEEYKKKSQCFVKQYGNYVVDEIQLEMDGEKTLGENIADNEGINRAYKAYELWIAKHGEEKKLPGLKYSPRQLFWISTAILWCTKMTKEMLFVAIRKDPHSPAKYRVNGMVSNQKEFAKDFSCPADSQMNPYNKCSFK